MADLGCDTEMCTSIKLPRGTATAGLGTFLGVARLESCPDLLIQVML